MRRKYTIYLSSTTYRWWNFKSYNWKKKLIKKVDEFLKPYYEIEWIDPLSFKSEDPIVCEKDLKDIDRSDLIIVYIDKLSIGTLLELGYCMFNSFIGGFKDVIVIGRNKYVCNHPWIVALCKDFTVCGIDECATLLEDKLIKRWYSI